MPDGILAPVAFSLGELAKTHFWVDLYRTGRFGTLVEDNLLLMMLARLAVVAGILLIARLAVSMAGGAVRRAFQKVIASSGQEKRRLVTLQSLLISSLSYLIYIIALIPILFTVGLTWKSLAALFATSSVVLLAVGLGSQKLVRDVVNGLFILGEGQFDVGDWVTLGAVTGRVEEMGLRATRLRDEQGRLIIISNGDINQVCNASRGDNKLAIEVPLPRTATLDQHLQQLQEIAAAVLHEHALDANAPRVTLTVTGVDAAKATVRLTLWIPHAQVGAVDDAIRRRLLQAQNDEALVLV